MTQSSTTATEDREFRALTRLSLLELSRLYVAEVPAEVRADYRASTFRKANYALVILDARTAR